MKAEHLVIGVLIIIIACLLLQKNKSNYGIMSADGNNYLWFNGTMPDQSPDSPVYFYGNNMY